MTQILSRGEWLNVSTEGFAEQQRGRPIEHLVKELVQNALDAIGNDGDIWLSVEPIDDRHVRITCQDSGPGAEDLRNLNVVFLTTKKDSVLQRGRMGRGFKELLSIAEHATVHSRYQSLSFTRDPATNEQLVEFDGDAVGQIGFRAMLVIAHDDAQNDLGPYFSSFLLPAGVSFYYNGKRIASRAPAHSISARLTTERFANSRWEKPTLATTVELFACEPDDTPTIFEMGIPVCPIDWPVRFHVNVLQRIPMNPNRDAVASGYAERLRRACLPTLLPLLTPDETRESWVGDAAAKTKDPELQRKVVEQAFGTNIARSTPSFGRFDHDQDAREEAGATILDTKQLTGGFKRLVADIVPSSKTLAAETRAFRETEVVSLPAYSLAQLAAIDPKAPANDIEKAVVRIGRDIVLETLTFCEMIGQKVLNGLFPKDPPKLKVAASILREAEATYSADHRMPFNLSIAKLWKRPADSYFLLVLIHELAHSQAMHHGDSFTRALERIAAETALSLYHAGVSHGKKAVT